MVMVLVIFVQLLLVNVKEKIMDNVISLLIEKHKTTNNVKI